MRCTSSDSGFIYSSGRQDNVLHYCHIQLCITGSHREAHREVLIRTKLRLAPQTSNIDLNITLLRPVVHVGGLISSMDDQCQAIGICNPDANGIASSEGRIPDIHSELAPHGRDGGVRKLRHWRRLDRADPVTVHVGVEVEAVRFLRPHHVHALVLSVGVALHVELGWEVVVDGHDARWELVAVGTIQQGEDGRGCNHEGHKMSQKASHVGFRSPKPADWTNNG